ncbi:hypothetical protein COO60DRAFT_1676928 [Scenedesmus sp. NREL 46B-D3]|nr:hypothetical protein COO60DRAFT_1676928 [Scenedesmus sp. NREL 46B-D3]
MCSVPGAGGHVAPAKRLAASTVQWGLRTCRSFTPGNAGPSGALGSDSARNAGGSIDEAANLALLLQCLDEHLAPRLQQRREHGSLNRHLQLGGHQELVDTHIACVELPAEEEAGAASAQCRLTSFQEVLEERLELAKKCGGALADTLLLMLPAIRDATMLGSEDGVTMRVLIESYGHRLQRQGAGGEGQYMRVVGLLQCDDAARTRLHGLHSSHVQLSRVHVHCQLQASGEEQRAAERELQHMLQLARQQQAQSSDALRSIWAGAQPELPQQPAPAPAMCRKRPRDAAAQEAESASRPSKRGNAKQAGPQAPAAAKSKKAQHAQQWQQWQQWQQQQHHQQQWQQQQWQQQQVMMWHVHHQQQQQLHYQKMLLQGQYQQAVLQQCMRLQPVPVRQWPQYW